MDFDLTIIGAGVIGLAAGEKAASEGLQTLVVEKEGTFGTQTSSRNSEVIHAGIYYPEGSLKAKLCVRGRSMLYDFCNKWDVPYNKCGKLIVATSESEIKVLEGIKETALKNGVELTMTEKAEINSMEPNIYALKALYSPETGIIDSHSLMKRLETNIINSGGTIAYRNEVRRIKRIEGGYELTVGHDNADMFTFTTRKLVNSAGLYSGKISEMAGITDSKLEIHFCKGEYFRVKPPKNKLVKRLIYPVPHHNLEGIGIHVTIDMGGGVKLGPDVTYLPFGTYDYSVDLSKQEAFYLSAGRFLPFLGKDDIVPEMAGIRPKIQKQGEPVKDFYIEEESGRGLEGFINMVGMESPGLTSCLAIAEYVFKLLDFKK